jgi:hypothetical protein
LRITKTPEYQDIDAEVRRSALGSMDATLARRTDVAEIREEIRDEMENAVPEAWRVLIHNLRQKRDLKAALEILDRDPQRQFAKGSQGPGSQRPQIGVGIQVGIDSRPRQLTL